MAKSVQDTPLMQQHRAIKQKYPDAILLFRVGDFYETFGEDAIRASTVLGITLTKRNNGAASSLELAGFPHHGFIHIGGIKHPVAFRRHTKQGGCQLQTSSIP